MLKHWGMGCETPGLFGHVARPAVTKVPVVVIDEFEVWKGELLLKERSEFILNRLCPTAYEDYELVDVPSDTASGNLSIVASELGFLVLSLSTKVLLCPYLPMQLWIINKGNTLFSGFLYHLGRDFFFANPKEGFRFHIVPENAYTGHRLVEGFHIGHLGLVVFVG